jgi:hypothetical protein
MKPLKKYEEWLMEHMVSYKGSACRVLKREEDEWIIETPEGPKTIKSDDPNLQSIDDIHLPLFLQTGGATIAF